MQFLWNNFIYHVTTFVIYRTSQMARKRNGHHQQEWRHVNFCFAICPVYDVNIGERTHLVWLKHAWSLKCSPSESRNEICWRLLRLIHEYSSKLYEICCKIASPFSFLLHMYDCFTITCLLFYILQHCLQSLHLTKWSNIAMTYCSPRIWYI